MKLTQLLLKNTRPKFRQIKGNKTGGKYRIPYLFNEAHRREMVEGLTEEAKNEMYLTRPFLNKNQEVLVLHSFIFKPSTMLLRFLNNIGIAQLRKS